MNRLPDQSTVRAAQAGSFIIEAIISLILFAVGLIGLLGLSAQGLNQVGQSKSRNDASFLVGELFSDMWVNSSVNLTTWNTKLQAAIPNATGSVYLTTCDCVSTATNACSGTVASGTVAISNSQAVTVCVTWTDRKENSATPRLYQASTQISRN